jgi:3-oxoacyl-[acyl-carrier protein] reductase
MNKENYMEKRIALVTGSTSGIGKATAQLLLKKGYFVITNSEKSIPLDEIKELFSSEDVDYFQADISNEQSIISLKNYIDEKYGRLDALVANAGVMPLPCGIDTITSENIDRTINTNLKGTFWTLKYLGELIHKTSKNGAIVTLTSVDGVIGEPYGVIYSTTKAGIISLMMSFARKFKNPIVRVNAVAPGLIDTPLSDSTGEDPSWTTDVSVIQRIGKPEEIAAPIVFLLSDDASYITGQLLCVDGGFTLK